MVQPGYRHGYIQVLPLDPILKFARHIASVLAGLVGCDDEYFRTNDFGCASRISVWERHKRVALGAAGLLVRGKLEKAGGAVNVLATSIEALPPLAVPAALRSRDFR
jgi:hypothetical protein